MGNRIKVVNTEIRLPLSPIEGLDGYRAAEVLFRLNGAVIGVSKLPVINGQISAARLAETIHQEHAVGVANVALKRSLLTSGFQPGSVFKDGLSGPLSRGGELPFITVAVCTRDRTSDLRICLASLTALDYPKFEVVVVDNAPSTRETKDLLEKEFPSFRYVCEPKPGLDNARNRAARSAKGEVIAYTDDDVIADPHWLQALGRLFAENPEAMAATGLVMPAELETEAQQMFERYGGFRRGFDRRWVQVDPNNPVPWAQVGTGQFGTGANMAFRLTLFQQIGDFDPALDVGTPTNGGGDLEFIFRTLKRGKLLVYEPDALVWHRHRRSVPELRRQIRANGTGLASYFRRTCHAFPEERRGVLLLTNWWLFSWTLPRLLLAAYRPARIPACFHWEELVGFFTGFGRYGRACRAQGLPLPHPERRRKKSRSTKSTAEKTAIRYVELAKPLQELADVREFGRVSIYFTWRGIPVGSAVIENAFGGVSPGRLADAAQPLLWQSLPGETTEPAEEWLQWAETVVALRRLLLPPAPPERLRLPDDSSVSIVIATRDRPEDLRRCLSSMVEQKTTREIQILVVDNHPASELTAKVVADFPDVFLLREDRPGLSYARNAGIRSASGDIIVCTDDDVSAPPDWIENLVAPFARADVAAVTGNVLPASLDSGAERLFELYGGLGRGFRSVDADADWFEKFRRRAVPTWELGATANAAFRASAFRDPSIGLMDEALGAGSPTGCSEDTYVFYKILKAGHTIHYEPSAWVRHHHRCSLKALRRQIFSYSKGHAAYHITTWLNDGDWRGLFRLGVDLPTSWLTRYRDRLFRRTTYPNSLLCLEIIGTLLGPLALWRARRRVKRLGSDSIPVSKHETASPAPMLIPAADLPRNPERQKFKIEGGKT